MVFEYGAALIPISNYLILGKYLFVKNCTWVWTTQKRTVYLVLLNSLITSSLDHKHLQAIRLIQAKRNYILAQKEFHNTITTFDRASCEKLLWNRARIYWKIHWRIIYVPKYLRAKHMWYALSRLRLFNWVKLTRWLNYLQWPLMEPQWVAN